MTSDEVEALGYPLCLEILWCGDHYQMTLQVFAKPGQGGRWPRKIVRRLTTLCAMAAAAERGMHVGRRARFEQPAETVRPFATPRSDSVILPYALSQAQRHREPLTVFCLEVDLYEFAADADLETGIGADGARVAGVRRCNRFGGCVLGLFGQSADRGRSLQTRRARHRIFAAYEPRGRGAARCVPAIGGDLAGDAGRFRAKPGDAAGDRRQAAVAAAPQARFEPPTKSAALTAPIPQARPPIAAQTNAELPAAPSAEATPSGGMHGLVGKFAHRVADLPGQAR